MILFRIFTGILFILPLVSSAEFVEDMVIRVQPAPEQQDYTMDTFGQVIPAEEVYQYQKNRKVNTPTLSFEDCDSAEDCAYTYHENAHTVIPSRIENADTPYAPFPWPCDSLADCAYAYYEGISEVTQIRIENSDTPYAPFPWPCDSSVADCAHIYKNRVELMDTPYAPFPWPCDSVVDCAHQMQVREIVVPF
ncbi:MAG: hypothetical protein OXK80_01635 [Bdellovibrionales bacterium]|nr:hypothetical protein [Bdellovibrionales bacterium]